MEAVKLKIRQCVWRIAHNSLAFKMNIKHRGVDLDTRCPVCLRLDEDGAHCFLKCKEVRKCWRQVGLEAIRRQLLQTPSAESFVAEIQKLRKDTCITVCVLLWRWWEVRNKVNLGEMMTSVQATTHSIMCTAMDLLNGELATNPVGVAMTEQRWSPPAEGTLKINCDGSFKAETKTGAWGFIIRDHEGGTVVAGVGNPGHVHDVFFIEALACKQALEAAIHFGISKVVIETDSSELKEALLSVTHDLAVGGGLVREIKVLVEENLASFRCAKIPRSCNLCAHELASVGVSWDPGQYHFWTDPLPDFVKRLSARDWAEHQSINPRP